MCRRSAADLTYLPETFMTATISRSSAILGAARTLAAKLLLAIPIDRAALTQAMTESAGGSDAARGL